MTATATPSTTADTTTNATTATTNATANAITGSPVPTTERSWTSLVVAEVALLAVHLAVAWGFGRLYADDAHLGDLVIFTTAAWLVTAGARRARLPLPVVGVLEVGGAALVATWLLFPDTAAWGLPTGDTLRAAADAVDVAGREFRTVTAPTEPLVGFHLLSGLALWAAVQFADWAAFRLRATVEALAPATVIFVFCSVLAADRHRVAAAALFAAAALVFVAAHRAHLAGLDDAWLGSSPAGGVVALRRAGLGVAAVAVLAGTVVAPVAPGFHQDPLVRWRETGDRGSQRDTVSPIVDLQGRLIRQTNREMFRVRSTAPSYWRLTSLNRFDGRIWASSAEFQEAEGRLPASVPDEVTTRRVVQEFEVLSLGALWVPAAFEAREVPRSSAPLLWDAQSSTLIVDDSTPSSDGLTYEVASETPVLDPATLRRAVGPESDALRATYLDLPSTLPARVRREAQQVVAGLETRYDRARALQDFFQSSRFRYSTDIPEGHGNDALVAFLDSGVGYCEQFAGAYAAMARAVGLPARVAVGFTSGDADPEDPTFYRVRGLHAHAWPEVHFPGVGWVPFEPTKGRGIPGAEAYTGLPPEQAQGGDEPLPTTTTTSTTTVASTTIPGAPTSGTTPPPDPVRGTSLPSADADAGPPVAARLAVAVLVVLVVGLVAVLAAPWLRARFGSRGTGARARVLDAWHSVLDPVRWRSGVAPRPAETHLDLARRAGPGLGPLAGQVTELADLAAEAAWAAEPPTPAEAERAEALAEAVRRAVVADQPVAVRVRRRLSWREAFGWAGRSAPA